MKGNATRLLGLAVIGCLAVAYAHAQVAISSTLDITAYADANVHDGVDTQTSISTSQGSTVNTLFGSVYSQDVATNDAGLLGSVSCFTTAAALWTNAGSGSVNVSNTGWDVNTPFAYGTSSNSFTTGLDIWTYTFQATSNGIFHMKYAVLGFGEKFGLQGFMVHWTGPGGDLNLTNAFDPKANGSLSRNLVAGQIYTVGIGSFSNVFGSNGGFFSGQMDGQFDWNIENSPSVPGPAAIIPFATGLIAAFRRRKKS